MRAILDISFYLLSLDRDLCWETISLSGYFASQNFDWGYLMKVILEMTRVCEIRYLDIYYYHWIETSVGRLLVHNGIIYPVVSDWALAWIFRYING